MTALETVITSVGTSALVVSALMWLLRTWIGERLHQAIAHEYSQKLERHKAELAAANAVDLERLRSEQAQERAIRSLGEDHLREALRVTHSKRIEAIDKLWAAILLISAKIPPALAATDFMTDEENRNFLTHDGPHSSLAGLSLESINREILSSTFEVANERLKAGEYLYALFDAYRTIVGRAAIVLVRGRDAGRMELWYSDGIVSSVLSKTFSDGELRSFNTMSIGKLTWVRTSIERRFMEAANQFFAGDELALQAMQQARAIEGAVAAAKRVGAGDAQQAIADRHGGW